MFWQHLKRFIPERSETFIQPISGRSGYNEKVDTGKLLSSLENIKKGIENYSLFQRFPLFRWPAWIDSENIHSNNIIPVYPPLLLNSHLHQWVSFSNLISNEEIQVDRSGMVCIPGCGCSMEIWVIVGDDVFRAQEKHEAVTIERDTDNGILKTIWKDRLFTVTMTMVGARSSIDECVLDIQCRLKEKMKNASVMVVVRPYDIVNLGTVHDVSYNNSGKIVTVNGMDLLAFASEPDFVLSGSGEGGDVNASLREDSMSSRCDNGLATMGLGFRIDRGERGVLCRVGLSGKDNILPGGCDAAALKSEFSSFTAMRLKEGAVLQFPDKAVQNWFSASKIHLLGVVESDLFPGGEGETPFNGRYLYYVTRGLHRMAYFHESLKIIDIINKRLVPGRKPPEFSMAVDCCYVTGIFADYFIHTRDLEYVRTNYPYIRDLALYVSRFFDSIKSIADLSVNSLKTYMVKSPQHHDIALAASALFHFSYISRCLGIFGDENRFLKDSKRLQEVYAGHVRTKYQDAGEIGSEFFYSDIYMAYPFLVESVTRADQEKMIDAILGYYGALPIHVKSLGLDVFSSIIVAHNILRLGGSSIHDVIKTIFRIGGKSYSLPEYVSPGTMNGVWGDGCSRINSAELFSLIRDLIFIDRPERLEIFPVPLEEWFVPGKDIIIENAPSRFGAIGFRVATTQNEVQIHFDGLPKYVPPEMLITLPFKTKIVEGDDFIVKKIYDSSFLVNGWPSIIRFIK